MRTRWIALGAALALAAVTAACEDEQPTRTAGDGRPGVTDDEIRVGGVVGVTNPVGRPYTDGFIGAQAYFDMVNEEGGVFGREINVVAERDDATQASRNIQQIRALVEEDDVFAVLPIVTQVFAGANYLVEQDVPAFGWNINAEWALGDNLFGEKGSFLCFDCPNLHPPYVAEQVGAERVAIFAYGASAQSSDCAEGMRNGFDTYGPPVAFVDTSLSFGFTDLSAPIAAIQREGVDFIAACMDVNGNANIAQAVRDAGVDLKGVYAPEGYAQDVLDDLGARIDGFFFGAEFVPFEEAEPPEGMQQFLDAMGDRGVTPSEQGLAGWTNAALLVAGIEAAGEDFTQQSVIDAINEMTDFTANGIRPPQNWRDKEHGPVVDSDACTAIVQVEDGEFVPVLGEPGRPFVCFTANQVDKVGPPDLTPDIR